LTFWATFRHSGAAAAAAPCSKRATLATACSYSPCRGRHDRPLLCCQGVDAHAQPSHKANIQERAWKAAIQLLYSASPRRGRHGDPLLCRRGVDAHAAVKLRLGGAALEGHAQALHDLPRIGAHLHNTGCIQNASVQAREGSTWGPRPALHNFACIGPHLQKRTKRSSGLRAQLQTGCVQLVSEHVLACCFHISSRGRVAYHVAADHHVCVSRCAALEAASKAHCHIVQFLPSLTMWQPTTLFVGTCTIIFMKVRSSRPLQSPTGRKNATGKSYSKSAGCNQLHEGALVAAAAWRACRCCIVTNKKKQAG